MAGLVMLGVLVGLVGGVVLGWIGGRLSGLAEGLHQEQRRARRDAGGTPRSRGRRVDLDADSMAGLVNLPPRAATHNQMHNTTSTHAFNSDVVDSTVGGE